MRQSTRRRYYARSNVAASLRSAAAELQQTIQLAGQPPAETPLSQSLRKVLKSIEQAIEYERLYQLGRKRIKAKLEREKRNLELLIQEIAGVPVTRDEKLVARVKSENNK